MPQFSIKRLLISTAEIAVGTAGYGWFRALPHGVEFPLGPFVDLLVWCFCGGCIGAGIHGLFNKTRLGFALGMIAAFTALVFMLYRIG
jgi:hypothetical protein